MQQEATERYHQHMSNIQSITHGDNSPINFTQIQMPKDENQTMILQDIRDSLNREKGNSEAIKFSGLCHSVKRITRWSIVAIFVVFAIYFYKGAGFSSLKEILINALFQTLFLIAILTIIFSIFDFIKLFTTHYFSYKRNFFRNVQQIILPLFTLTGAGSWVYLDFKINMAGEIMNQTSNVGYAYFITILMGLLMLYSLIQITQLFLLNNHWKPKQAIYGFIITLLFATLGVLLVLSA